MVPGRFRIEQPAVELPLSEKHRSSTVMYDEQTPLLDSGRAAGDGVVPAAATAAATTASPARPPRPMPQAIAHRGYKACAPENTMLAFRNAVAAGAHAIETDLHLSRDGVVVLSHDETLKRCFGEDAKVRDRDWAYLGGLRTLRKPAEPMPRLLDLLEYLNEPGLEGVWVMLDVKTHDDADEILRRTAETLASVPSKRPWSERVMPCCWSVEYIKLCTKYLPDYRITHVGWSTAYARGLADIPHISFSMLRYTLASPFGRPFMRDMRRRGIPIHVWTVNEEDWMEWSIRKELDGVITDDPKLFLEVCGRMGDEIEDGGKEEEEGDDDVKNASRAGRRTGRRGTTTKSPSLPRTLRFFVEMAMFHVLLVIFMTISWFKHGPPKRHIRKTLAAA